MNNCATLLKLQGGVFSAKIDRPPYRLYVRRKYQKVEYITYLKKNYIPRKYVTTYLPHKSFINTVHR